MYVRVLVHPDSKKERILQASETEYTISVREKAERNQANRKIVEIIASEFNVEEDRVRIVSGHRSQRKIISIE